LNILEYYSVHLLTDIQFLLVLYFDCVNNQKSIYSIAISPSAGSNSVFYRVFIAAEIEGAGGKGSVDSTMIDVESLMGGFF
jgi:hypothetical protein